MAAETELAIILRLKDQLSKEIRKAIAETKKFGKEAVDAGKVGKSGFDKIEKEVEEVNREVRKLGKETDETAGRMTKANDRVSSSIKRMVAGYLGLQVVRAAVTDAIEFRKAMSDVSTIVDTATVDLAKLSKAVTKISLKTGIAEVNVAQGLYQTLSADVVGAADAVKLLDQASQLALAGSAETKDAVELLSRVYGSYNVTIEDAAHISDVLFTTVRKGLTTIPEMGASFGSVIGNAASLGITLEEVGAAIATLSKTMKTAEAVTALDALFTAFIKGGETANKVLGDQQDILTVSAIKNKGLTRALADLIEATGGSEEALIALTTRKEAYRAAIALGKNSVDQFNATLEEFQNVAGATRDAVDKKLSDPAIRLTLVYNELKVGLRELGDEIVKAMDDASQAFKKGEDSASGFRDTLHLLKPVVTGITGGVLAMAVAVQGFYTGIVGLLTLVANMPGSGLLLDDITIRQYNIVLEENWKTTKKLADASAKLLGETFGFNEEEKKKKDNVEGSTGAIEAQVTALEELRTAMQRSTMGGIVGEDPTGFAQGVFQREALLREIEILRAEGADRQVLVVKDQFEREVAAMRLAVESQKVIQSDFEDWLKARRERLTTDLAEIGGGPAGGPGIFAPLVNGANAFAEGIRNITANVDELAKADLKNRIEEAREELAIARDFVRGGTDQLVAFATGAKSAKDAFLDFARDFLTNILRMIIQTQLLRASLAFLGPGGLGIGRDVLTATFGSVASAKGNAFDRGNVVPFADGGVISRATIAPMALMGEAGPEAIMPLRRGSNGKLGVEARGGGGSTTINIGFLDTEGADGWVIKRKDLIVGLVRQAMYDDPGARADFGQ